jgi:hypothetical protein
VLLLRECDCVAIHAGAMSGVLCYVLSVLLVFAGVTLYHALVV